MADVILPSTIGATIDALITIRSEINGLNKKVSGLKAGKKELEDHFLSLADEQDTESGSGKTGTASIGEDEMTSVEDWDLVYKYIRRNNAFYLLERRVAQAAMREIRAGRRGNKALGGTSTFMKRKVNLRAKK